MQISAEHTVLTEIIMYCICHHKWHVIFKQIMILKTDQLFLSHCDKYSHTDRNSEITERTFSKKANTKIGQTDTIQITYTFLINMISRELYPLWIREGCSSNQLAIS